MNGYYLLIPIVIVSSIGMISIIFDMIINVDS